MNRVLVLDNDRTLRTLMTHALSRVGLEAVPAATAEEGEAALDGVAAVLMDFHLGAGRDGAEVLLAWASRPGGLPPCWVVTGMPDHPGLEALEGFAPLQRVVGKPFSVIELAEEVADAVRKLAQSIPSAAEEALAAGEAPGAAAPGGVSGPVRSGDGPKRASFRADGAKRASFGVDPVALGWVRALLEPLEVLEARRRRAVAGAVEREREAGA